MKYIKWYNLCITLKYIFIGSWWYNRIWYSWGHKLWYEKGRSGRAEERKKWKRYVGEGDRGGRGVGRGGEGGGGNGGGGYRGGNGGGNGGGENRNEDKRERRRSKQNKKGNSIREMKGRRGQMMRNWW